MNPAMKRLAEQLIPKIPEFYYNTERNQYMIKQTKGDNAREWIPQTERQIHMALMEAGVSGNKGKDEQLSPVDALMRDAQSNSDRSVHFAGPIAGHPEGLYCYSGSRFLVTVGPRVIKPEEGKWDNIRAIINGLFTDPNLGDIQLKYLHAHNKLSYLALRLGDTRGMPAQVFCGPQDCGKSFYQDHILTPLYGGRMADPYKYMSGKTEFNSEMFGAEHMKMSDIVSKTDLPTRKEFGAHIKQMVANENQRMRAMYAGARNVNPYWRLTIGVNNELEDMLVLPPITQSLKDKLSLFRAYSFDFPTPIGTREQQREFAALIASEIPAYLHWLMDWEIPEEVKGRRWTVGTYRHPEILRCLNEVSPEYSLAGFIQATYFSAPPGMNPPAKIEMNALDLERGLTSQESPVYWDARQLLSGSGRKVHTYLGRLEERHPGCVFRSRGPKGERMWTIQDLNRILDGLADGEDGGDE